ncbi:transposase [Salmonella enterica]
MTARYHSSGGKTRLSGITKRGDGYMRKLLVQGARAVIYNVHRKTDTRAEWIKALQACRPTNIVAIAQTNKIARIAWAVFMRGEKFYISSQLKYVVEKSLSEVTS